MRTKGVSGSSLFIGPKITRKTGKGTHEQAEKMLKLGAFWERHGFKSPVVYFRDSSDDGPFYDMQTVHGTDAMTYLHSMPPEAGVALINKLWQLVKSEIYHSEKQVVKKEIWYDKMHQVMQACQHVPPEWREKVYDILQQTRPRFDVQLPVGVCHGDLTFSNLVMVGSEPYLIDPIPVFLESPILDAAKLIQDLRHQWTANLFGGCDSVRLHVLALAAEMPLLFDPLVFRFCCVLNLARILPYVKDPEMIFFVFKEISTYG